MALRSTGNAASGALSFERLLRFQSAQAGEKVVRKGTLRDGLQVSLAAAPTPYADAKAPLHAQDDTAARKLLVAATRENFEKLAKSAVGCAVDRLAADPALIAAGYNASDFAAWVRASLADEDPKAPPEAKPYLSALAREFDDLEHKAAAASTSAYGMARILLDIFAMHVDGLPSEAGPTNPLMWLHGDGHYNNLEVVKDDESRQRPSLRLHDCETGALLRLKDELRRSGVFTRLAADVVPRGEASKRARREIALRKLRGDEQLKDILGKKGRDALVDFLESRAEDTSLARAFKVAWRKVPKDDRAEVKALLKTARREIEEQTTRALETASTSEFFSEWVDTVRRRSEGESEEVLTPANAPQPIAQILEERSLHGGQRVVDKYVDTRSGQFNSRVIEKEIEPLPGMLAAWTQTLGTVLPEKFGPKGSATVVSVGQRFGCGGASLASSSKFIFIVEEGGNYEIWYAKEPMASPYSYNNAARRFASRNAKLSPLDARIDHAERTIQTRKLISGGRQPEEWPVQFGGKHYVFHQRDPSRTKFGVEEAGAESLPDFSRCAGHVWGNAHYNAFASLPKSWRAQFKGTHGDLRDVFGADFVGEMSEWAERDARALRRYHALLAPALADLVAYAKASAIRFAER